MLSTPELYPQAPLRVLKGDVGTVASRALGSDWCPQGVVGIAAYPVVPLAVPLHPPLQLLCSEYPHRTKLAQEVPDGPVPWLKAPAVF